MVGSDTLVLKVGSKYLKKQIRLAASAHPGYNLDHPVVLQGNKFVQILFTLYTFH